MDLNKNISLIIAENPTEFADAKLLFIEYANSLDVDLAFQDFEKELQSIDVQYNKPFGGLVLAYINNIAAGCAGIRKSDGETAELKRMFVRPEFRGQNIAQQMLLMAISLAKELNYKRIRLDTLPSMSSAQKLYKDYGFYEIPPYRYNPVEGSVFMEKDLDS
ncbi:MAG: GNAT family N-acetyltransferase [Bacteroidetes bacterium]|nr:GNAT family N-acetyltransferase [Bacteroidota bacterium]